MMLTNEIEHYDCNSGIVLKLDKPKQNLLKDDLFSCSATNSHRLS
jgi:hypothetical protein